MLTPTIDYDDKISMADMKKRKTDAMENLLLKIFNFTRPLKQNNLGHARSTAGQFHSPSSSHIPRHESF